MLSSTAAQSTCDTVFSESESGGTHLSTPERIAEVTVSKTRTSVSDRLSGAGALAGEIFPLTALERHANPQVTATIYAGLTEASREQLASKLAKAFR